MNNLRTVASFEFEGFIKKKKNWIMVGFVAILAILLAVSPLLIGLFSDDKADLMYIYSDSYDAFAIKSVFGDKAYPITSESELNSMLSSGEVTEFYDVNQEGITLYSTANNAIISQPNTDRFKSMFTTAYYSKFMEENGLLEEFSEVAAYANNIDIKEIEVSDEGYTVLNSDNESKTNDLGIRYLVGYFFIMLTYISMMQYGSYAATTVGNEKASRTMETLIYSTDTNSLIYGKVLGVFLGSIIQVIIMCLMVLGGAYIALNIGVSQEMFTASNISTLKEMIFGFLNFGYVLMFILLYALGFLITLFIFASLAATVSKVEEISSAISTGTIITMLSFFLGIALLMSPDNSFLVALSYFPLFTPLAMFSRFTMGSTSTFDIIYAIVVPAITVVLIGMFAAKLYKVGVLLYGTKPSLKTLIFKVFSRNKK